MQEHDKDILVLRSSQLQLAGNPQLSQLIGQVIPKLMQHRGAAYSALGRLIQQNAPAVGGACQMGMPPQPPPLTTEPNMPAQPPPPSESGPPAQPPPR